MKRGFTLVEIMIIVAIIALLAAIAIPNLTRARLQTNELAAQSALKTIAKAEAAYRSANPNYATLSQLGPANTLGCATEPCIKSGYSFTCAAVTDTFVVRALPQTPNVSGARNFCITEDGTVRVNATITAATDHATCQGYAAISP